MMPMSSPCAFATCTCSSTARGLLREAGARDHWLGAGARKRCFPISLNHACLVFHHHLLLLQVTTFMRQVGRLPGREKEQKIDQSSLDVSDIKNRWKAGNVQAEDKYVMLLHPKLYTRNCTQIGLARRRLSRCCAGVRACVLVTRRALGSPWIWVLMA